MKLLMFSMIIIFSGCTNIRHATNINASQVKGIKFQLETQKKLNKKIKVISEEESKKCQFVQEYAAKDTVLEQGKEIPIFYIKAKADELDANAIIIDSEEKIGDYGHTAKGRIFTCPQ